MTAVSSSSSSPSISSSPPPSYQQSPGVPRRRNPFLRKPLTAAVAAADDGIGRHMSLVDLVSIGLGGTIGSGIFVLSGFIATRFAGPATPLCFAISGAVALLSGCCYAELATIIPTSGSSYAYVYIALGEYFAVVAAACLTLEYMISGAAVARSWGDKVVDWLKVEMEAGDWVNNVFLPFGSDGFNPLAGVLSGATVYLLYRGVKESKDVTNVVTVLKIAVVVFMTVGGLFLYNADNTKPFVPASQPEAHFMGGMSGVLRGATSSFFGYLGYDEVCCVAGEAINPTRNVPKAVLITISTLTILYICATISLTGMQKYSDISETSGFSDAFHSNGVKWAAQVSAFGEVFTLPLVVLVSLIAQPRVFFAMSVDGLMPRVFKEVDYSGGGTEGNLTRGILICGVVMTIIAAFVPFALLNDMISAGVMVSFSLTDSSLLLLRRSCPPAQNPNYLGFLVASINGASFVGSYAFMHGGVGTVIFILSVLWVCAATVLIHVKCPEKLGHSAPASSKEKLFRTPLVPFVPCIAIFINWYLIAQLELTGLLLLATYMTLTTAFYFFYSIRHSIGNNSGWGAKAGEEIEMNEKDDVGLLRVFMEDELGTYEEVDKEDAASSSE